MNAINRAVAAATGLPQRGVDAVVELLQGGATVPFISRYRKEKTGALDEVAVRAVETALARQLEIEARREVVLKALDASGALTPDLDKKIRDAVSLTDIEDIYAPYRPRRRTRAEIAREKGLEPLARIIMAGNAADVAQSARRFTNPKVEVATTDDAIAGASDIIAEWAADNARLRGITRNSYRRSGMLTASVVKGKESELAASPFAQYDGFTAPLRRISSHQFLALKRAVREGLLKVRTDLGDASDSLDDALCRAFIPGRASDACADIIADAVCDASKRLLRPSVENEISAELKDEADRVAIDIFAGNLRQLLLAAPLRGRRVLALDPGYRTGCKVVAVDENGTLLADTVIYPVPPKSDIRGAAKTLSDLIKRFRLDAISLGNGTASRETEAFLRSFIADTHLISPEALYVVSESGASVYSASDLARKEFPDKDVTVRGAVSIGRRLIDPLAELVKIDPKAIGVGQYQHDVDQTKLKEALDYTVMSCVNAVGIDINTASERLLSYISGIGPALASNIVAYRTANGSFTSRAQLRKVPRLGDKAFELAAGFLRVPGGTNPLDNTGIHPESYGAVKAMADSLGVKVAELPANGPLLDKVNIDALADAGVAGRETLVDIVAELRKPGRDPRVDGEETAFVPAVDSFDAVTPGSLLPGIVENITAFGAFVNLGIKERGLIHISQLSNRRVASVSDVLHLGQRIDVRVIDVDRSRRRISLSLKDV
ncbi:MAG: RNA-binding transcriptional accessory protein [Bacteroidales bacterium]|nr:RNA-binding transcriptional accessory protein [Bacteroidales bacterium]